MDKNAIKKYAVWARTELIERVTQKAQQYEISADADPKADDVHGKLLSKDEKDQRAKLISKVKEEGYDPIMEEVAYTWFNRFSALRFMEVNNYLPSRVRVFTDADGAFKPQILTEAIHMELKGLDMEKVYALKEANDDEELFKYLLITQCNALSEVLPGMFQKIADYTELLFPDNLLRDGSVLEKMVVQGKSDSIPECDWEDQIQIIGWLYQYYNSEPKDKVFADLKKNIKITKENIPAATQLFTPDWIVRYMVENSLGRLWVEGHPSDELKTGWKYYLEEAKQEPEVQAQLDKIREEYRALKPEEIKCIDPCMGSGHILVYMFDVLMQIYASCGYSDRDAVKSILENNLYGLDIDDRAAQLAYFSVMMKARQYDARFFSRKLQPHVYAICESNGLSADMVDYFVGDDAKLKKSMDSLITEMRDAKEYGSILNITPVDFDAIYARFDALFDEISMYNQPIFNDLLPFVRVAQALAQKYDTVCTNPPYMGSSGMGAKLGEYVKKNYPDSKSDLFAVFIERCGQMTAQNCYQAMITQHAWMFLSSFEKLRAKLLQMDTVNMAHLGARAFDEIGGEVVQTTSFVLRRSHIQGCKGVYCRLIEPTTQNGKEEMFLAGENRYESAQDNFSKIPGSPIAYWVSEDILRCYENKTIYDFANPCKGIDTGDNSIFLRLWHEVSAHKMFIPNGLPTPEKDFQKKKWFPYNKGGNYRKWYGNNEYILNWENNGSTLRQFKGSNLRNKNMYFEEGITWSTVTSGTGSFRFFSYGFLFDNGGSCLFARSYLFYIQGLLNSSVSKDLLTIQPTINNQPGTIGSLPLIISSDVESIETTVKANISLSKIDWDSFEISWDFKRHPLVMLKQGAGYGTDMSKWNYTVKSAYEAWERICNDRFNQLKANEESLNRIFIDIYGLQDELTPEVEDKDVTVHYIADTKEDAPEGLQKSNYLLTKKDVIKSLISYAVGCMFGRYSLDVDGLAYAGGSWDATKYQTFPADRDNIIPISDDEYFDDDIVNRFVKFIEVVYGKDTLEENLKFVSDAVGGKGAPREVIRNYFLNDFFKDHCKTYQKRPIYWLFDSGKKNGFKCLIYMHRYQPDTIARIRTDYVYEQQARYRTAIEGLERQLTDASTSERVKINKQLTKLKDQAEETRIFEEKIHHLADQMIKMDLDDGVKHNYEIFKDVLAKIK